MLSYCGLNHRSQKRLISAIAGAPPWHPHETSPSINNLVCSRNYSGQHPLQAEMAVLLRHACAPCLLCLPLMHPDPNRWRR
ncbi:hypothetical protein BS78_10G050400 [Paspalum vaginatum]|nr:hypothetical protein BS78_10G050400 [Paspalum vaginatum]